MQTLAFVLSTLGTVCICIPPLLKGKNMKLILLLVFLTNVLIAASYLLTGATGGAITCCVGAVQTIINFFFERKLKPIPVWLIVTYAITFVAANLIVFSNIFDIIAILAALMFVMGISVKSGKKYRLWTFINTALWIIYDFLTHSYGPLSTHAIQLSTIIFGMIMHDRKKNNT
ncbi:MAG: YgjV family protein [Clostridia bacterium]|nr:YgjV family protein [Clostridia bacterium]